MTHFTPPGDMLLPGPRRPLHLQAALISGGANIDTLHVDAEFISGPLQLHAGNKKSDSTSGYVMGRSRNKRQRIRNIKHLDENGLLERQQSGERF